MGGAGQGSWEHAWGVAGQTSPEEELMDPTATAPSQGGSRGRRRGSGHKELAAAAVQSQEGRGRGRGWEGCVS
eukprot:1156465-Pelagomonas_calceolata.AAC.6